MTPSERHVALTVMEKLREDILWGRTKDGRRIVDAGDMRRHLTDRINHIRSHVHMKMSLSRCKPEGGYEE
jgi:hypothetical protein